MATQSIPVDHRHITPEIKKLRGTITTIDSLSQEGFSEIAAIARLALTRLETPDGYRHPDDIAHALTAIWGKAKTIEDCINYEAEAVGSHYVDQAQRRRWDAQRAAQEETAEVTA